MCICARACVCVAVSLCCTYNHPSETAYIVIDKLLLIDFGRLLQAISPLENNLSEDEKQRNQFGSNSVFNPIENNNDNTQNENDATQHKNNSNLHNVCKQLSADDISWIKRRVVDFTPMRFSPVNQNSSTINSSSTGDKP